MINQLGKESIMTLYYGIDAPTLTVVITSQHFHDNCVVKANVIM
jgi:hypothetical protein